MESEDYVSVEFVHDVIYGKSLGEQIYLLTSVKFTPWWKFMEIYDLEDFQCV